MIGHFLKKSAKDTLIYGIGGWSSRLISMLLIPLFTRVLTVEEYGYIALITTTTSLLSNLLNLGMGSAFFKFYNHTFADDEKSKSRLFSTIFLVYCAVVLVLLVCPSFFISDYFASLIAKSGGLGFSVFLALIALSFDILSNFVLLRVRAEGRSKYYSFVLVSSLLVRMLSSLLFVLFLGMGIVGVFWSLLVAAVFQLLLMTRFIYKRLAFVIDGALLKKVFALCLPLTITPLFIWILNVSDRYILNWYLGPDSVGQYSLAYNLGAAINVLIVGPFMLAWTKIRWDVQKKEAAGYILARIFNYLIWLLLFVALFIATFAREIIVLLAGQKYLVAAPLVGWVVFAYVFYAAYQYISFGMIAVGKTRYYPLIFLIAVISNLAVNFVFVPRFGMVSAAIATFVAYLVLLILGYVFNQHFYKVPYAVKKNLILLVYIGLFFFLALAVDLCGGLIGSALKAVVFVVCVLGFYFLGFIKREEKFIFWGFVKKIQKKIMRK